MGVLYRCLTCVLTQHRTGDTCSISYRLTTFSKLVLSFGASYGALAEQSSPYFYPHRLFGVVCVSSGNEFIYCLWHTSLVFVHNQRFKFLVPLHSPRFRFVPLGSASFTSFPHLVVLRFPSCARLMHAHTYDASLMMFACVSRRVGRSSIS